MARVAESSLWPAFVRAKGKRASLPLWIALVALQAVSAGFFLTDVIEDLLIVGFSGHTVIETIANIALIGGVILGSAEIARLLRHTRRTEADLEAAVAAFSELIAVRFKAWGLTQSEREVALLALKGFDISEIAKLRTVSRGTVRAQLSHIYDKAGTRSRGEFVSSFLDLLIDVRTA